MNDDKWLDTLAKIKSQFAVEEESVLPHPDIDRGRVETVVFQSPLGKIKLVRTTTPRVLDKKTVYSRRAGSDMAVQYEYSDTEFVNNLKIYKWDDLREDWLIAQLDF